MAIYDLVIGAPQDNSRAVELHELCGLESSI